MKKQTIILAHLEAQDGTTKHYLVPFRKAVLFLGTFNQTAIDRTGKKYTLFATETRDLTDNQIEAYTRKGYDIFNRQ